MLVKEIKKYSKWINYPENQLGNSRPEHYRSNRPNRHIQNILSNNSRIYIFPKHTWNYILGYKTRIRKVKKTEIIPSIFWDHNGRKPEIENKKKTRKFTNTWQLNNTLLKNQGIKEESK